MYSRQHPGSAMLAEEYNIIIRSLRSLQSGLNEKVSTVNLNFNLSNSNLRLFLAEGSALAVTGNLFQNEDALFNLKLFDNICL